MLLPTARGPLSAGVIAALLQVETTSPPLVAVEQPERLVADTDFQLALWVVLEAAGGGFDGVVPERADDPELLRWRTSLTERWLTALRSMTTPLVRAAGGDTASPSRVGDHLISLLRNGHTELYSFVENKATAAQLRELVTVKSLFARSAGQTVIDRVPAAALAAHNTMRVLCLGATESAAIGHHAASAAIAVLYDAKLARGLLRAGLPPEPHRDAHGLWARLLETSREHLTANPARTQDLLHAAAAAIVAEAWLCRHLLRCWAQALPVLEPARTTAVQVIGTQRPFLADRSRTSSLSGSESA